MASKAQLNYANQIVKYFDRHPNTGVELDTDDVLTDMETWTDRHAAHKAGQTWMSDSDRAALLDELRPRLLAVEDARRHADRASTRTRDARRAGADEQTLAELRKTGINAMEAVNAARREAKAVLLAASDRRPDTIRELQEIAHRGGIDL